MDSALKNQGQSSDRTEQLSGKQVGLIRKDIEDKFFSMKILPSSVFGQLQEVRAEKEL